VHPFAGASDREQNIHSSLDLVDCCKPRRDRMPRKQCSGGIRSLLRWESDPYDLLARTRRQVEAVSHVAPSSDSQPFDTALRAYSGQAVDLQEATGEAGIRVAEYYPVINQWQLL